MSMIEFDDKYTGDPAYNHDGEEGQDGFLETFEPSITQVQIVNTLRPKTLWTVVEGDDGNLYIVAGYHLVNRLHYVVTVEEWSDDGEEYMWCEFEEDDDDG